MKRPAMPGESGHDGAAGELFVKGNGGERRGLQQKSILKVVTGASGIQKFKSTTEKSCFDLAAAGAHAHLVLATSASALPKARSNNLPPDKPGVIFVKSHKRDLKRRESAKACMGWWRISWALLSASCQ
jgi:hypothetical protein